MKLLKLDCGNYFLKNYFIHLCSEYLSRTTELNFTFFREQLLSFTTLCFFILGQS
jgi:hypothetical protein